jgi:hypothetical protein
MITFILTPFLYPRPFAHCTRLGGGPQPAQYNEGGDSSPPTPERSLGCRRAPPAFLDVQYPEKGTWNV